VPGAEIHQAEFDLAQSGLPRLSAQASAVRGFQHGRCAMPYRTNIELPDAVQRHLPPHAQDIYREAFNHAFATHVGDPRQEEAAHRIAWAAVKKSYVKVGDSWIAHSSGI
jgi:cation transport regulator